VELMARVASSSSAARRCILPVDFAGVEWRAQFFESTIFRFERIRPNQTKNPSTTLIKIDIHQSIASAAYVRPYCASSLSFIVYAIEASKKWFFFWFTASRRHSPFQLAAKSGRNPLHQ
jgi:hypothetical protein